MMVIVGCHYLMQEKFSTVCRVDEDPKSHYGRYNARLGRRRNDSLLLVNVFIIN